MATVNVDRPDEVNQFASGTIASGSCESPGEFTVAQQAACQHREATRIAARVAATSSPGHSESRISPTHLFLLSDADRVPPLRLGHPTVRAPTRTLREPNVRHRSFL